MREAVSDMLAQEVTGATEARVTFEIADVYSENQLDIALGVTYKSGVASVKNQFDFSKTDILSRTVVKFLQVYYTIDVDIPEKPSDLFASLVTWSSLDKQINGDISPMYVSSIAYGRMALFTMESTYSSTEIHNALQASVKAINTSVDLDVANKNILQQSSIKATIIGGSGQSAVQAVNGCEGLREYMTTGGNYSKGTAAAPLAYKLRYLCDNGICRVVMAGGGRDGPARSEVLEDRGLDPGSHLQRDHLRFLRQGSRQSSEEPPGAQPGGFLVPPLRTRAALGPTPARNTRRSA